MDPGPVPTTSSSCIEQSWQAPEGDTSSAQDRSLSPEKKATMKTLHESRGGAMAAEMRDWLLALPQAEAGDPAVAEGDHLAGAGGHIVFVGHHHQGDALAVQLIEDLQHLGGGA